MSLVVEADKGPADWIQDMVHLPDLTQESILENLKLGYAADEIYTYVGPVLVSINPYKRLTTVFGEGMIERYAANKNRNDLKPHVYCIAQMAFNGLVRGHKNQSVLVSGESGAGKTEVSKFILSFITKQSTKDETGESLVEKQILEANPILESFGNAKTMRNNNSSRFGKFTKIYFKDATIVGSAIEQYLLEKSRVVGQTEGDRNYHIFFFMFRGLPEAERAELGLTDPKDFHYLNQSTAHEVKGIDDAKEWEIVQQSYQTFKFTEDEVKSISRTLAAILHIGNINFQFNDELKRQEPANKEVVKRVADLLGLAHPQILEIVLTTRKVSGGGRGSTYSISNTAEEVMDFRDALAKDIYARLFVWLVRKINIKLVGFDPQRPSPEHEAKIKKLGFIGVLDIFGFEVFEHNSFEQLCINFANEKLHQQFLEFMFKVEQEEYTKEGIEWSSIEFDDNGPCLELIEAPMGVLSMLDEECVMPKGSDESFLEKLESNHARHKFFGQQKRGKKATAGQGPGFEVKHFAYPVYYEVEGFLYKNRDRLYPDLEGALQRSKAKLIKSMYPAPKDDGKTAGGKKKKSPSLGGTFKKQLQSLYDTIFATEPHYIRCIKPNPKQQPDLYDDEYIGRQLSYVGVMETIRVRKAGFSLRMKFDDFARRFGYLAPAGITDHKAVCEAVLKREEVPQAEWKMGKTKAFMKDNTASVLDEMMQQALRGISTQIQAAVRGMLGRRNILLKQADLHKQKLEELREKQRPLAFLLQSATRAMFVRKAYNAMQAQYHKYMEEERKRKEEEERKRKEEEERKRKEEEERKRREEEERKKAEEERKRREEEEKAKLAAMAEEERQKAQEELKAQEEARQKAEEERKAKEEAERKAKENEEKKKAEAEEKARKEADMKAREALTMNLPSAPTADELAAVKVEEMPEEKKDEYEEEEEEEEEETGRLAMALFDYDGKFLKDGAALMLRKWQIVEIIDELSNDWWLGSAQGQEGLFPAAYVEELGDTLKTVVAEYDFESSTDGHLNFFEGTTILVVEERDGWMWGHYDGVYGRFPANYCYDVSQLQQPTEAIAPAQTQTTVVEGSASDDVYAKVPVFHDALPDNAPDPPDFLRAFVQRKLLRAVTPLDHRVSVIRGRDLTASPMVDIAMYLFDDILFFARYHPEDLVFDAVFYVSLADARLIDLAVDPERHMEGFQIEVKGRSLYTFIFDLPSQKRDWREDCKLVTRKFQAAAMMKLEQELTKQNGKKPGAETLKRKSSMFGKMKEKLSGKKDKSSKSVDVVGLLNPCQLFISELPEVWRSMFSQIGVSDELSRDNTTAHLDAFTLVHVACIQERGGVSEAKTELEKSLGNTMDTMRKKTLRAQGSSGLPGS